MIRLGNVSVNPDEAIKMGKDKFLKSINNSEVDKGTIWAEIEKAAKPFEHKKPSRKSK